MAKKNFDMSGVLTSDASAARPLTDKTSDAPKPAPRPTRAPASAAPVALPTPEGAADTRQLVGLTHKLDSERYAWMREYLHAEQRRRGDYRYSGQQLYVETLDLVRLAAEKGLSIANIKSLLTRQ